MRSSSGSTRTCTYARLAVANDCIRAGAHFIATNRDPVYPTERGLRPGSGRWSSRWNTRRGRAGLDRKPGPFLFEAPPRWAPAVRGLVIGDVIATDLAGSRAVGARA
jgi:ribonucleotide monophosphatase NagD (HAD superfamily)